MVDYGNLFDYNAFKDMKRKQVALMVSKLDTSDETTVAPDEIMKEAKVNLEQFIDTLEATSVLGYALNDDQYDV